MSLLLALLLVFGATQGLEASSEAAVNLRAGTEAESFRSRTFPIAVADVRRAVVADGENNERCEEAERCVSSWGPVSVGMGDFVGYRWALAVDAVEESDVAGTLLAEPLSEDVGDVAVRFWFVVAPENGRILRASEKSVSDVVRVSAEELEGVQAVARLGTSVKEIQALSDAAEISVVVEAWTTLEESPSSQKVRVHLQRPQPLRSSAWWGRSVEAPADAVALIHLLETDTTRSVVRMLAPAADPSTFRRALVDARDRAAVEQGSFAQEDQDPDAPFLLGAPPRRAAEWSPDEIDESVDATMVLSDASQRDFGDLVTFLTLARTMRLSGGGDGLNLNGDDAGAKLEDILRALEGGTLPPAGGFPDADHLLGGAYGAYIDGSYLGGSYLNLLPSSAETAMELLIIVSAGLFLTTTGWYCALATKPLRNGRAVRKLGGSRGVGAQVALASLFAPIQAAWTLLSVPLHASGFVARHLAGFAGALVESVSLLFHGWGETDEAALVAAAAKKDGAGSKRPPARGEGNHKKSSRGTGSGASKSKHPKPPATAVKPTASEPTAGLPLKPGSALAVSEDELSQREAMREAELRAQRLHAETRMRERQEAEWAAKLLRDGSSETPVAPPEPTAVADARPAREKAEEREKPSPPPAPYVPPGRTIKTLPKPRPTPLPINASVKIPAPSQQPPLRPPLPPNPPPPSQPRNVRVGAPPGFPGRRSAEAPHLGLTVSGRSMLASNVDRLGGTQWADAKAEMSEQETLVASMLEGLTSVDSPNPTVHGEKAPRGRTSTEAPAAFREELSSLWGSSATTPAASPLTSPTARAASQRGASFW